MKIVQYLAKEGFPKRHWFRKTELLLELTFRGTVGSNNLFHCSHLYSILLNKFEILEVVVHMKNKTIQENI